MAGTKRGRNSASRNRDAESDNAALLALLAIGAVIWVIVTLIWWILAAAVLVLAARGIREIVRVQLRRRQVHSAYQAVMVARADQQNDWALSGDERGIYGTAGSPLIEPPRPWSARRLAAAIGAVVTVALVAAVLLVQHPFPAST